MKNSITITVLLITVGVSFLLGTFVGCGAQRKGETVKIDTVYKDKIIVKNSVPRVIDSIVYKYRQVRATTPVPGTPENLIAPANDQQDGYNRPAYIVADTLRSENLDVATLDTISENRITGRKWWVHDTRPTIRETRTVEKKLPLFSLYGGAHATNMPTGTFYGADVAVSVRNNAFVYCNYTFVQNSTQFGVMLRLSK